MALEEYRAQTKEKIEKNHQRAGGLLDNEGKPSVAARAALTIEAAELMLRGVLTDVMAKRNTATMDTRSAWQTRIAHAVFMCREATQDICSVTGASGSRLENPMQRALRDIDTASNHVFFDREARYADFGRLLLDQPIRYLLV